MKSTVLIISQVYVPDPASVGQHLHDVSRELVRQGKRVLVFAPTRGYEDPSQKYKPHEVIDGVQVRRLPFTSLGKSSIFKRLMGGFSLALQAMILGLFVRNLTHILVSTAPPVSPIVAQFIALFRKVRIVFWAMDINPDQIVATGKLSEFSLLAKIGNCVNKSILRNSHCVITLDSFMAERLCKKEDVSDKLIIIPPWPYEHQLVSIDHSENPFRDQYKLNGKFVVMYSGNISPTHPIDTLLQVAVQMKKEERLTFMFIGGLKARREIEAFVQQHQLPNVITSPYVPLSETKYSLSAADLHIITMGNNMVGIVHPCKVYGVMSVGRPFLLFGPKDCHIGQIMNDGNIGWRVEHGDVESAVDLLKNILKMPREKLVVMGNNGREIVADKYSRQILCSRFCEAFK